MPLINNSNIALEPVVITVDEFIFKYCSFDHVI